MVQRGVNAAVGDQPQQVHPLRPCHRRAQHVVLCEPSLPASRAAPARALLRAPRDRLVDAHQVLRHDRACAQVQVADLRVAHLSLGEANGGAARQQRGVRVGLPQLVEDRRASK